MSEPAASSAAQLFNAAVDTYERGDTGRALSMLAELLQRYPDHPGALYMSGSLLLGRGELLAAVARLEAAVQVLPGNGEVLQALADAYSQLERWPEAVQAYQAALAAGRGHPDLLNNLGLALKESGDVDGAIAVYQQALLTAPDDADLHNNLAIALNRNHDYAGAIAAYRRSTELEPGNAGVWSNLAMLYEQSNMLDEAEDALQRGLALTPGQENLELIAARCERRRGELTQAIARLEHQLPRPDLTAMVRRSMEFELGRSYDVAGDADRAYMHLLAGNRLTAQVWPDLHAGAELFMSDLQKRLKFFSQDLTDRWPASPPESRPSPVFLVGFPRSGTTLMDTMLDAHPAIDVLEEEPMLERVIKEAERLTGSYPEGLLSLRPEQIAGLRELYWREADALGSGERREVLLDKNPFHSAHAGMIRLLFPGARFIFALRHPCDVALSCFMQGFGNNPALENFRDLTSTATTYSNVMDLWAIHQRHLGADVHTLRYESLVEDKRAEMGHLLDFLGLDWEESMEDHTRQAKKRGRIYTPSYHQVIKPVYRDALGRWQRYRKHFGSALDTLAPYVEGFGYSLDG
jgi:tetratricopeptide (TPR) repeat protein